MRVVLLNSPVKSLFYEAHTRRFSVMKSKDLLQDSALHWFMQYWLPTWRQPDVRKFVYLSDHVVQVDFREIIVIG